MRLPPELLAVLQALRAVGRPRLVGGCVRDWLLGHASQDFDVEVPGTDFEGLHRVLSPFGSTDVVGRSFGVIKLRIGERDYDFSLPRRESKSGAGHRGFEIQPEPGLSDAEAAARRDFTVNAIAYDPFLETLIDPLGGERDLRARVLRHASPAFVEDPLRVLRAMQFGGRFNFSLAPDTALLCKSISATYHELPVERVWGEWAKWAEKSQRPSKGLQILRETGWMAHFPEIADLDGTRQDPEWHPEGDVFVHTGHCCDSLVRLEGWQKSDSKRRRCLMFATLAHDFGKPGTTSQAVRGDRIRWISPKHEAAGGPIAETFLERIGAPKDYIDYVRPLVVNHMVHYSVQGDFSYPVIRRLAKRLAPATVEDLCLIMRADHDGRPPMYSADALGRIGMLLKQAKILDINTQAPQPILLGRHLIAAGMKPNPEFKTLLDAAFEVQLEGGFTEEAGAVAWLHRQVPQPPKS